MPDPNRSYPGGNGHPAELPIGVTVRGNIGHTKTYKGEQRDPGTGKFKKGPGTLRLPHMTGWSSQSPPVRKSRYDFQVAMIEWNALSDAAKGIYRDRAAQIRIDHPNPFNSKSSWLGHNLYASENIRRNAVTPPDYESAWTALNQGQTIELTHNIGGTVDNYIVVIDAKNGDCDHANQGIGGEGDVGAFDHGFYWCHLTTTTINISRGSSDPHAPEVRIRIWETL